MFRLPESGDFEETGGAHPAAYTHGDDDVFHPAPLTFNQRVPDEPRPGHSVRVADGDCPAIDVEPLVRNPQPITVKPRKMPSGRNPRFAASAPSITTHAEARSENWLALPAATTPPGRAGLIRDTPSYVVSGRIPSSAASVTSFVRRRPESLSATPITVGKGTISSLNFPSACAAAARCWLCT